MPPRERLHRLAAAPCADRPAEPLIETHQLALRNWIDLAQTAGVDDSNLVIITSDESQPAGFEWVEDLDELTTKTPPAGPVH